MVSNFNIRFALILVCAAFLLAGCGGADRTGENSTASNTRAGSDRPSNADKSTISNGDPDDAAARSSEGNLTTGNAVAKAACMVTEVGGKRAVQKSQTFAIDFEPFKGSCFVTSYNPEYGDIHMETQFDVYKNGKKIFSFPDQFNGSTFGCWVDGVAFRDLNHDGLADVIVVGKCTAKQADYNENMVYVNTGKGFTTREDGNNKLGDLKTIKEITDFVDDNQQIFF